MAFFNSVATWLPGVNARFNTLHQTRRYSSNVKKKKKLKKTGASEQRELRTRVYGHESENE